MHKEILYLMDRKATAQWKGDLMSGAGTISTASGVLSSTQYSFKTRFEQGTGTNPEELLAGEAAVPGVSAGLGHLTSSVILSGAGSAQSKDPECARCAMIARSPLATKLCRSPQKSPSGLGGVRSVGALRLRLRTTALESHADNGYVLTGASATCRYVGV